MATINSRRTKLTDKRVSDLQPEKSAYDVTDTLCKGLLLRCEKSGTKSWVLQTYTPDRTKRYRWRIGDASTYRCYKNTPARASDREQSIRDVAEALKAKAKKNLPKKPLIFLYYYSAQRLQQTSI